jgi:CO dehydrogenase/acetyl-CoA synthase beta subunit
MKKNKLQDQFFEELRKIPIVQVACEKTGVSRNSVYRWKKEDKSFSKKMDEALKDGVAFVNDMSESQLLTLIKEKSYPAISFWLRHRNDNYKDKIEVTTKAETEALSPAQAKIVRNALKLAAITKSKSIKNINKKEYE